MVAQHTVKLGNFLGNNFTSETKTNELAIKILTHKHHVANIVEGCNSASVIILFLAFIIAFAGSIKNIFLFGTFGILSIYALNILRIVIITIALDRFPEYSRFLHQILFPAIIYGYTFLLWIIWVRYFAYKNSKA